MKNAREAALMSLYEIDKNGAYPNLVLKRSLPEDMAPAERALAVQLVYGVLQRRITLDYMISRYSSVKLKKLSVYVINILRLGLYQLDFMDRIPPSAAVNESVKLAKRYAKRSAGFVNAILRAAQRGQGSLKLPEEEFSRMSVEYAFPVWMCRRFVEIFGRERAASLMEALNREPQMTVRVNTLRISRKELIEELKKEGAAAEESELCPDAVKVFGLSVAASRLYREGMFTVQDTASMLSPAALAPDPGDRVIDLCAAPGGKTTYLAQLMENRGLVTAFDIHEHKVRLIEENARRMGFTIIEAKQGDGTVFLPEYEASADKVLVDAPCSGWGIIRRKPDIKHNAAEYTELPQIQLRLLENAARYLKKGGELVYSTCTLNPEENEGVIERFLELHPDFSLQSFQTGSFRADSGKLTLYPDIHGTDGFFIGKLKA